VVGNAISRVARSERRTTPITVMHSRLSARGYGTHQRQASGDGGANGQWAVENGYGGAENDGDEIRRSGDKTPLQPR
jgi:hypothetical protein